MSTKLATRQHPYYPQDWLAVRQAEQLLEKGGLYPHITKDMCLRHQIEYASTGHIRRVSLELYIKLETMDEPDEEERLERQAQAHLEAAALHRDDPMF